MERLSSGLKINHASDNPSGIAIASRMQAQIDGLNQANNNSNDGTSVIQTADGALNEVADMLQRMRELSVQAANGTNSKADREAIQKEIESLKQEIDRISQTTQFNTKNLLDGSMDARIYGEHCSRIQSNEYVPAGTYMFQVIESAEYGKIEGNGAAYNNAETESKKDVKYTNELLNGQNSTTRVRTETEKQIVFNVPESAQGLTVNNFEKRINGITYMEYTTITRYDVDLDTPFEEEGNGSTIGVPGEGFPVDGYVDIDGVVVEFKQHMTGEQVFTAIREASDEANIRVVDENGSLVFTSKESGDNSYVKMTFSSDGVAKALGLYRVGMEHDADKHPILDDYGRSPVIELKKDDPTVSLFGESATTSYDGRKVTVTDTDGFELSFMLDADYEAIKDTVTDNTTDPPTVTTVPNSDSGWVVLNVTDIGIMKLQIGSNMGQTMSIRIKDVSCNSLYIDDLDVSKENGPEHALSQLDSAIAYISGVRSQLGAYENRLEHTSKSLTETGENITSAISRIEDVDMATEMVEYTRLNVLEQSGMSALSQANELPQLALQLLQ